MTESHLTIEDARRLRDLAVELECSAMDLGVSSEVPNITEHLISILNKRHKKARDDLTAALADLTGEPIT